MRKKNLGGIYSDCFNYIKESKNFIYSGIAVFFAFALIGFLFPAPESFTTYIQEYLSGILEKTKDFTTSYEWIWFIFQNNIISSFIAMASGIFFGIYPVIASIANGYIVGFVGNLSVSVAGFSSLLRLVPHGIFELPAIFISIGLGIKLGTFIFQKEKLQSLKYYLWNSLKVFLFVIIPLLILAAIIEGSLIFYELG